MALSPAAIGSRYAASRARDTRMNALLTVLDANRQLVQFLYGQAFFIAALAIALRV